MWASLYSGIGPLKNLNVLTLWFIISVKDLAFVITRVSFSSSLVKASFPSSLGGVTIWPPFSAISSEQRNPLKRENFEKTRSKVLRS